MRTNVSKNTFIYLKEIEMYNIKWRKIVLYTLITYFIKYKEIIATKNLVDFKVLKNWKKL